MRATISGSEVGSRGFKRYLANTLWMVFEKAVRMATILAVTVYVARYLGPRRFGLLNYSISFVGLFAAPTPLGPDAIVVREFVRRPGERRALLGTTSCLKLAGALSVLAIIAISPHGYARSRARLKY